MNDEPRAAAITVRGAPAPDPTPLSERIRESVRGRIRAFLEETTDDPRQVREAVRTLDLLPLADDGERWYGVRPNADVVSFNPRPPHEPREEEDPWRRASALSRGSERYPELVELVPPAPLSARVCPRCHGTGRIRVGVETAICVCGGLGWIPPISDERSERGPRDHPDRSEERRGGSEAE